MIDRRRFLVGAGSVAIGLPALWPGRAQAKAAAPRLVTLFFGNGLPPAFVTSYEGPLSPMAHLQDRLTLVRGLDGRLNETQLDAHVAGSGSFGVGRAALSPDRSGGVSLDRAAFEAHRPPTPLSTLEMGLFNRRHDQCRVVKTWAGPDRPNPPIQAPYALFRRIFGGAEISERSVLDTVMGQYTQLRSKAGALGAQSRALLDAHLDTLRDLERKISLQAQAGCERPAAPPDLRPQVGCSSQMGCGHWGIEAQETPSNWDEAWLLNVDLFVHALSCDMVRYGSVTLTGGGDRYDLGARALNPHELAHEWRAHQGNEFEDCVRWIMEKVAYFLDRLAQTADPLHEGQTLLDNTLVLIGTELSDPAPHSRQDMSFLLAGGPVRPGRVIDAGGRSVVDLYSSCAALLGVGEVFGDPEFFSGHLDL